MLGNYLKVAWRHIIRHKGYSLINIFGLAVGLACAILILMVIRFEMSFDRFHAQAGRIFRFTTTYQDGSRVRHSPDLRAPLANVLKQEFPEIAQAARLFTYSYMENILLSNGRKNFYETRFFLADPSVFAVFSFPFLKGDPAAVFSAVDSVVITEETAHRYFGNEDPLGKIISVKFPATLDLKITGVLRNVPANSHFHFDFLAPLRLGENLYWKNFEERTQFYTYILLKPHVSAVALTRKMSAFVQTYGGPQFHGVSLSLQPLTRIHLYSNLTDEIEVNGDIQTVYFLLSLAFFILLIACINFVNLSSARSALRAKEVCLRKVVGAARSQLLGQFLSEAVLFSLLAFPCALILVELLLPAFNRLLGKSFGLTLFENAGFLAAMFGIALVAGFLSGIYPALILSGFQPERILKSGKKEKRRSLLRNLLVVFQYAVAVVFIIGTLVVIKQMHFVKTQRLGYEKENIVVIPVQDEEAKEKYDLVKAEFLKGAGVERVAGSEFLPLDIQRKQLVWWEGAVPDEDLFMNWNGVDFDFLETYGIGMAAGRSFYPDHPSDTRTAYVINETAARQLGWKNPVGKIFNLSNKDLMHAEFEKGVIIGMVRDFYFHSLRQRIEPLALKIYKGLFRFISVKIRPGRQTETIAFLKSAWERVNPFRPFDYFFFRDRFDSQYRSGITTSVNRLGSSLPLTSSIDHRTSLMSFRHEAGPETREDSNSYIALRVASHPCLDLGRVMLPDSDWMALLPCPDIVDQPVEHHLRVVWRQLQRPRLPVQPVVEGDLLRLRLPGPLEYLNIDL